MKSSLCKFLFVVFLFVSTNLVAQQNTEFKKELLFGVNFGVNLTDASFGTSYTNSPFKTKMWQRFAGGISAKYLVEKNLGLIVELNYSQQGWEQNFEDPDVSVTQAEFLKTLQYQRQLNYLQIPFLTHIYFGNKVRFNFNLGPQISFLINDKEVMNEELVNYLAEGEVSSNKVTDQYYRKINKKIEYGILGGIGMEFRTGLGIFAIEGRYILGLSDFFNNSKADPFQQSANRNISIKATYYIKINK